MFAFQCRRRLKLYWLAYLQIIVVQCHNNSNDNAVGNISSRTNRMPKSSSSTDINGCPDGDCSCQLCVSLDPEEKILLLTAYFPTDVKKASVYLFNANGYSICDYVNLIQMLEVSYDAKKDKPKFQRNFGSHDDGTYCVGIRVTDPKNPKYDSVTFVTNLAKIDLNTVPTTPIYPEKTAQSNGSQLNYTIIVVCTVTAGIILTVLIFVFRKRIYLCIRRNSTSGYGHYLEHAPKLKYFNKIPAKVFILYCHDCPHHVQMIEAFAEFLTKYNCEVCYDNEEYNNIAISPQAWINNKINSKTKIIIVNSAGAYYNQQAWFNGTVNNLNNTEKYDSLFMHSLVTLMHKTPKAFDYPNIFMIRFEYTNRDHLVQNICPGKCYVIPTDLSLLLCHVHGTEQNNYDRPIKFDLELVDLLEKCNRCECWKNT